MSPYSNHYQLHQHCHWAMVQLNPKLILAFLVVFLLETECHYNKHYYKDYRTKQWDRDRYDRYGNYRRDNRRYDNYDSRSEEREWEYPTYKKKASSKKTVQTTKTSQRAAEKEKPAVKAQKKIKKPVKQNKVEIKTETVTQKTVTITEIPIQEEIKIPIVEEVNISDNMGKIVQEIHKAKDEPVPSPEIIKTVEPKIDCSDRAIYDYNLLVLTWVPQECYADIDCEKDWQTYDDLRSPTIHAFRPYGSSSYYENCFELKGDPNCYSDAFYNLFEIDEALWNVTGLLYEINQYWPALKFTHDEDAFYSKQWLMHGTCYLMNMIEDNPNAYKNDRWGFNRTIMVQYFRTAISKLKKLAIVVEPGAEYKEKEDFAADIGFKGKETHFILMCNNKNEIVEIIFCFNRSKLPGKEVTIPCTLDDTCDESKVFSIKKPM